MHDHWCYYLIAFALGLMCDQWFRPSWWRGHRGAWRGFR
jgi:hypothetical protein